jgi:VCBS repeat-containing protein
MSVTLFTDSFEVWAAEVGDFENLISGYIGDADPALPASYYNTFIVLGDSGRIEYPLSTIDYYWFDDSESVAPTFQDGVPGETIVQTPEGYSFTWGPITVSGVSAFGFYVLPNLDFLTSVTVTLFDGQALTRDVMGWHGPPQFFGYVLDSEVVSTDGDILPEIDGFASFIVSTNSYGNDFAIGKFYFALLEPEPLDSCVVWEDSILSGDVSERPLVTGSDFLHVATTFVDGEEVAAGIIALDPECEFDGSPTATIIAQTLHYEDAFGSIAELPSERSADFLDRLFIVHVADGSIDGEAAVSDENGFLWRYTIADNVIDFLGRDESVTVTSTIRLAANGHSPAEIDLTVTIKGENDAPVAIDDASDATTGVGGIAFGNVLANDTDLDGDSLSVTSFAGGAYGNLSLDAGGSYSYSVTALSGPTGAHLHDVFNYVISDGNGGGNAANLDITLNRGPSATNDLAGIQIGGAVSGNVLANDTDLDGDSLSVTSFAGGAYGNLSLDAGGWYSYTVTALSGPTGSHLHDVFNYTISDGYDGIASANLNITLNRGPSATSDVVGIQIGGTVSGNVLANDSDPDGDVIQVTGVTGGSIGLRIVGNYGTLVLNGDGSYIYASDKRAQLPGQGFAQDVFTYTQSDGFGGTANAMLNIMIVPNGQNYLAGTPGQSVAAGNGKSILDASLGNQTATGGNGADSLIGGPNNVLAGGNGPDSFIFKGDFGHNEITDFASADVIVLEQSVFGSAGNVLNYAANDGLGNVIITSPDNSANKIVLDNTNLSQLSASDFVLV